MNTDIILEKIKFYSGYTLNLKGILDSKVDFDYYLDNIGQQLVFTLKTEIYGKKLPDKEIKYPANWFQAVKERFGPKWLLKYFPVKYKIIVIDATVLYPDINIKIPNHEHYLALKTHEIES